MITESDMLEEHYYGLSDWELAVLFAVDGEPITRRRLEAVLELWAASSTPGTARTGTPSAWSSPGPCTCRTSPTRTRGT